MMKRKEDLGLKTAGESRRAGRRITLCMIVKNEEASLRRCLESVKDAADEIVLVDTGSTDRTVEIAESYGARIFHHPWENNFSKHRNQSLSYATGDWILIMDADEELDKETAPMVREVVNQAPTAVVTFNVRSYLESGAYYSEGSSPRLFRNGFGFHYRGYVHNQLILKDKITPSSIVLWHYGYDLGPEELKAKQRRSLDLLRKQLKEFPDDLSTRHHLAMTLLACGEYEEACREAQTTLQKRTSNGGGSPYFAWTYFVAASSLMKLERTEEAEAVCRHAIEEYDWNLDIYHCLSQIKFQKGDYEEVLEYGSRFLELRRELLTDVSRFPMFQFETPHRDWVVHRAMGYAHIYSDRKDEGIDCLERALERVPECDRAVLAEEVGLNLTRLKAFERAIPFLEKLPQEKTAFRKGLLELGKNLERTQRFEEALSLYRRLENSLSEVTEIAFKRGQILLKLERYAEAAGAFEAALEKNPDYAEALINCGLALEKGENMDAAEEKYLRALTKKPDLPKAALNLGLLLFGKGNYPKAAEHLERAFSVYPENLYLCVALSKVYLETGRIEAMLAPCESALRSLGISSSLVIESVAQLGDLYLQIAGKLLNEYRLEAFDVAADIGLRLGPGEHRQLRELAEAAFEQAEYERGVRLLEAALAVDGDDPQTRALLQMLLDKLEEVR